MRLVSAILVALPIALVSFACGSSNAKGSYGEGDAVSLNGPEVVVTLKDQAFSPKAIKIRAGTTVTWASDDAPIHNVVSIDGLFKSSDPFLKGDRFSYVFDQTGTYRYQCTYHHPTMLGVVIVE